MEVVSFAKFFPSFSLFSSDNLFMITGNIKILKILEMKNFPAFPVHAKQVGGPRVIQYLAFELL